MSAESFSLTDFVGGSDHNQPNHDGQSQGGSGGGGGQSSGKDAGMDVAGAAYLWKKMGYPGLKQIEAWGEKHFPKTTALFGEAKTLTTKFLKAAGEDLEKAPGKIMAGVRHLYGEAKGLKDEVVEKAEGVFHEGEHLLGKGKEIVDAVEHPGSFLEKAAGSIFHKAVNAAGTEAVTKVETAAVTKVAATTVEHSMEKAAVKTGAKFAFKAVAEDIPILSAVVGTGFAINRLCHGDWTGAAMEETAGIAGCVPGAGTVVSTGINIALAGKDMLSASQATTPAATPNTQVAQNTPAAPAPATPPGATPATDAASTSAAMSQVQSQAGPPSGTSQPMADAAQSLDKFQQQMMNPSAAPASTRSRVPGLTAQLAAHPEIDKNLPSVPSLSHSGSMALSS
jgi:hypothetical protein